MASGRTEGAPTGKPERKIRLGLMLAVYLGGLLIGGLYVGMVSPARLVIQADFGIGDTIGIWIINIYTLFYAALSPVIGKLADRLGRRRVFMVCMGVFCIGSVMCGLSQSFGGFSFLLVGRVVQAVGAGGVIPVANAEIATSVPEAKRGMALGIAAAIMGVSNVFGAVVGSAVIGAFGVDRWPVMFYLCIPFCILIVALAATMLPDSARSTDRGRMDFTGALLFAAFVLFLLLGMKDLDFTAFGASFSQPTTWVPFVIAVAILPIFRLVERRADDPVFHLEYFHSRPIVITMIVSFFIGCFVISLVLVPELAEYAMDDPLGSGGYYILAMGITSFVTTPIAGRIIDKVGPKPVLITGLAISIVGLLFLALVAMRNPSFATFVGGLMVVGAGMGMTMGAPTNYMILENTDPADSTTAIATITLIRQIGTTIAPALLVTLIAATPGMGGYQNMVLAVAVINALALISMLFYRSPHR